MDKFALVQYQAFDEVQLMLEATRRAKALRKREFIEKTNREWEVQQLARAREKQERARVREERRALAIAKFYKLDARDGSLTSVRKRPGPTPKPNYRGLIDAIKTAAVCSDCEKDWEPVALGFDHVPERGPKVFNLSQGSNKDLVDLMAEMAKCDIVCHGCHAIRTNNRIKAKKQSA